MTSVRKRKAKISPHLTRGCGLGRHAWGCNSSQWRDADGTFKSAWWWNCWACGRIENNAPFGTFAWMCAQVVQDNPELTNMNEIGREVETRFYGIPKPYLVSLVPVEKE